MKNLHQISNPIYFEFKKHKLIKKENLVELFKKTRDKKIPVLQDRLSKIIFLKNYITNSEYYKYIKDKNNQKFKKNLRNFSLVKISKKIIKSSKLDDDQRRAFQFKKALKNKHILDFGTAWGNFLKNLKNFKSLSGIEIRKACINHIKKNYKKINIKTNINEFKKKFDVITLFHVLEHLPQQVESLKILKKKLNKNGKIIVEVPHARDCLLELKNADEFKNFTFWSEHLVLHTELSLKKVLKLAGFKKIKIIFFQRYGLANHLGWVIKRKPGGHLFFKDFVNDETDAAYIKNLQNKKKTDTLIAVATR